MTIHRFGFWLTAGAALAACSSAPHSGATPDAGPGTTTPDSGASHPKSDAGAVDSGTTDSGTTDGGTHPADGGAAPTPFAVTLQNSGRHGDTLLFTVQGNDPAAETTEVHVQLLDGASSPVVAFDTDWDGVADSAEQTLHFDQSTLGQKNFAQAITLPGIYANAPTIASAIVSLSDANGHLSSPVMATLQPQPVVTQGTACDVAEIANRCAEGLSCSGTPTKCQAGVPPSLTQVVYYGGLNPSQVFVGADPDEDLSTIIVSFLDATSHSLTVDLSGDGTLASSVALDARSATGQTFFFADNPVSAFTTQVPKISVTPVDSLGHSGAAVVASLSTQPIRSNGQACDAYGVSTCSTNSACSPGLVGSTNTCATVASLQTTKCNAAAPVTTTGALAAWGLVRGTSLWDPPAGCTLASEVGHPEGIVALQLANAVGTLTVSTATPETDFDTVLYVMPACASTSSQALGCNDDMRGYSSTVTLTNVPAGNYTIVVDSANSQAGHYGLSVTMTP